MQTPMQRQGAGRGRNGPMAPPAAHDPARPDELTTPQSSQADAQAAKPARTNGAHGLAAAETARERAAIQRGDHADKVPVQDPAMAPLGTDDEAAGTLPQRSYGVVPSAQRSGRGFHAPGADAARDHARPDAAGEQGHEAPMPPDPGHHTIEHYGWILAALVAASFIAAVAVVII